MKKEICNFTLECYECKVDVTPPKPRRSMLSGYRPTEETFYSCMFNGSVIEPVCIECFEKNKEKYFEIFDKVWAYTEKHKEEIKARMEYRDFYDGGKIDYE